MPVNQNIEGVAISDVNNDGKIDIFLAAASGTSYLLLNDTDGPGDFRFIHDNSGVPNTSSNPINVNADGEGLAFADYDNDGDMDFYLNINGGSNQLWQNSITATPTNYLKVVPEVDLGAGITRPALGATVIVSDGCTLFSGIQEVSGGIGHGSQNDSRLHFGLPGGNGNLYKVEVSFVRPNSGARTTVVKYVTPSALTNQTLTVLDSDVSDASREPMAVDDAATTDENTLVSVAVLSNDSDPNGEALTLSLGTAPSNGVVVINGNNLDYTPNLGFFGVETFTYFITNTSGLCAEATVSVTITAPFLSGYDCRKRITIDADQVSGSSSLTGFPMLVSFTDAELATTANGGSVTSNSGFDIVFTSADGTTLLDHELMSYTAVDGTLLGFVNITALSATSDTDIFMYYGNASVTTDQSSSNTWDSDYEAVLHLQESGNGTDDEFLDATSNNHHGTGGGLAGAGSASGTPTQTTGKFGFAQDFNDGDSPQNHIRLDAINDATWMAVTVQAWLNADDSGDDRIFGKSWGTATSQQTWLLRKTGSNIGTRLRTNTNNNGGFDPFPYSTGTWYLAAVTWDAGDNQLRVFVNGVQQNVTTLNGATLYTTPVVDEPTIGNTSTLNRGFDGLLQEARVSTVARSADWLLTEYNNQNNPASFYSIGPEDCDAILEISLLQFDATYNTAQDQVELLWRSSYDDLQDEGFEIQRSWNTSEWETLEFKAVKGLLNEVSDYQYNDLSISKYGQNRVFYRLKLIEANGVRFSEIRSVLLPALTPRVEVFPNPVDHGFFTVRVIGSQNSTQLDLLDVKGRTIIKSMLLTSTEQIVDASEMATGVYLLKIHAQDFISYRRLIIY